MTSTRPKRRFADRAMTLAIGLSLAVHAGGLLAMTVRPAPKGPTTDVVGNADEMILGLDLAPPLTRPTPAPVEPPAPPPPTPEPAPDPIPEPTPEPATPVPEPAPTPVTEPPPAPPPPPTPQAETIALEPAPIKAATPAPAPVQPRPTPVAVSTSNPTSTAASTPRPAPAPRTEPAVIAFAGVKAERARSVVYAVDVSGVMVGALPLVFEELERCIARLGPDQQFQVVLFRDPVRSASESNHGDESLEALLDRGLWIGQAAAAPKLQSVTEAARTDLRKLLAAAKSDGASNPLTGLRLALSMKPDVVFLLTRGIRRNATAWGPGEANILQALEEANPKDASGKRATTIRTIQFIAADPSGLLDRIAKDHGGGSCTVLTVSDLTKPTKTTPSGASTGGARR